MHAVIFDMDGVLIMSEEAHCRAWQAVGASRGRQITHAAFLSCFGRINPDCVRILFGEDTPPEVSRAIADEKERAYRDIVRENLPLAPGVRELLADLHARGLRLAVGSSAPRENIDLILDAGNLREFFHAAVDGSEVARGKPAPDVFLMCANRLGIDPEHCAVIEDAPAGIRAAHAAGMRAIALATTHGAAELEQAGAHALYPTLADLTARDLIDIIG